MTDDLPGDYEDLTECGLSPELEERLVSTQRECVFMWTNANGEAFGVVMSYLPKDGKLWLTAAEHRKRIAAIRRFPRAAVCINSTGTRLGPGKTVTYKGSCVVHTDRETKDWFYPEFSRYLNRDAESAEAFQRFLDSPHRVVIEFTPDYSLSFDGVLMWARSPEVQTPKPLGDS
jgi:general stress protein 26